MSSLLSFCLTISAIMHCGHAVSTKMDFDEQESTSVVASSNKTDDEDVEVKHTIVVSTKLNNNNRRGIHSTNDGNTGTLTYNLGQRENPIKEDSGEVPIINGYEAVESTRIRTPDTRHKTQIYPDSTFVSRNVRDEYDIYPNLATNPAQWKPSTFFNNINSWNQDIGREYHFVRPNEKPIYQNQGKIHRKITDDSIREFYCKKCIEMSNAQGIRGCIQQRSNPWHYETTSIIPKMKLDGKLAKLN